MTDPRADEPDFPIKPVLNDRRRKMVADQIADIERIRPVAGATVLEIGANPSGATTEILLEAGARRVISTNRTEEWPEETKPPVELRRLDARAITPHDLEGVDIVLGIAVLEHIDGLPDFFAGVKRSLRPGGLLYVHGGPIWSFAAGHHVWVNAGARSYRFSDPAANPLPNWSHLTHSRSELLAVLADRDVPPADAEMICDWIHKSPNLNRIGFRGICEAFEASGLSQVELKLNAFTAPSPEVLERIEAGPNGGHGRYDVSGVTFIATA